MFTYEFWIGFTIGATAIMVAALSIAIWFVVQAANFHDSWLNNKENQK